MLDYMIWPWFERFPCMDWILKNYTGAVAALTEGRNERLVLVCILNWKLEFIKVKKDLCICHAIKLTM